LARYQLTYEEWDGVQQFLSNKAREAVHVFCKNGGYPLLGNSVSGKFKNSVIAAGLSKSLHFHSLRHTGISWLINRGVPPPFVQRIAGHSSLSVTRIYTHLEDGSLQKAVNSFGTISSN
jgi:site-specific recombinase XerD